MSVAAYDQAMKNRSILAVGLAGLVGLFCLTATALPAYAGPSQSATACPYQAPVPENGDVTLPATPQVGQTVQAVFDLKGYKIPTGAYTSINVEFPDKPEGSRPQVRPGYPQTALTFDKAGAYRITFILNEISKPSCGGVNARQLLEKEISVTVAP
jgi:hypothetical protein